MFWNVSRKEMSFQYEIFILHKNNFQINKSDIGNAVSLKYIILDFMPWLLIS